MKILKKCALSIVLLSLSACTSQESAIKTAATAAAESQFMESIQKEAQDNIKQSDWLRDSYIAYIKKHSEFTATNVQVADSSATATVTVETYPNAIRRTLVKIAGTVDATKARQFNFGDALQLIGQQTGGPANPEKQNWDVMRLHKNSAGDWQVENH